jgi:quinol monooxygenase YgiN
MKILITCTIQIDPKQRDIALREAASLIEMARQEPGCLSYNWGADMTADDTIYVYEEWLDQASLHAHFTAPSFFGMSEHLAKHGLIGAQARKLSVEKECPIYDSEGTPRADFF